MKERAEEKYFLHDPAQTDFLIPSVQHFYDNAINPCQESTYNFLETVVKYLKARDIEF